MALNSLIARIVGLYRKVYGLPWLVRWGLLVLAVLVLTAAVSLLWDAKQLIRLPKPGGPLAVGRELFDWTDLTRQRELMVFVWYPAASDALRPRSKYLPSAWARQARVPAGVLVSATDRAPPQTGKHPVLILSPAMGRIPPDYTTLAEDLASYGYIVVGVTPTGSARVVVFPNGRSIRGHDTVDLEHRDLARPLVERWVADFSFVLNRVLSEPGFKGRIDERRIGVFGHSFGGAAAMHALRMDRRFQRAANLDGAPEGQPAELDRPALFLLGAPLGPEQKLLNDKIYLEIEDGCNSDTAGCHIENYPDAGHMNFSDAGVLPRHFWQRGAHSEITPIDGPAFLRKVSERLRLFFGAM